MTDGLSKSQIDRLGERLKSDQPSESDIEALDQYRRSFSSAYDAVVRAIRDRLGFDPTGRPSKTLPSLREKLRRESIRLTQIQDVAGCRIVTPDLGEQERVVSQLCIIFTNARVVDRRASPSYGYRAVHVIAAVDGKHVEIQVRTSLQHRWAEVSEKCSDSDPGIKYGGGDPSMRALLTTLSEAVAVFETMKEKFLVVKQAHTEPSYDELQRIQRVLDSDEEALAGLFNRIATMVESRTL